MSELAELIAEAVLDGMKYFGAKNPPYDIPAVIDRVIAENAINTCVYCGEVSFKGFTIENGRWTSIAQQAMTNHVLSCSKRPEAKLTAALVVARRQAQMAHASLIAGDVATTRATLVDLVDALSPEGVAT